MAEVRFDGRVAIVTGSGGGLGRAHALLLASRGAKVVVNDLGGAFDGTGSGTSMADKVVEEIRSAGGEAVPNYDGVDTWQGGQNIVKTALDAFGKVDILINNAGIFTNETFRDLDFEEIRRNFEVNALGPLRVTHALQDRLRKGAKIVLITSRMGSIGDNGSGAYYGYRMAKAALNMAGVNLAHDLRGRASVAILHPGLVATRMTGFAGISTEESAAGLIARIDALQPEDSGGFWHANGERLPW